MIDPTLERLNNLMVDGMSFDAAEEQITHFCCECQDEGDHCGCECHADQKEVVVTVPPEVQDLRDKKKANRYLNEAKAELDRLKAKIHLVGHVTPKQIETFDRLPTYTRFTPNDKQDFFDFLRLTTGVTPDEDTGRLRISKAGMSAVLEYLLDPLNVRLFNAVLKEQRVEVEVVIPVVDKSIPPYHIVTDDGDPRIQYREFPKPTIHDMEDAQRERFELLGSKPDYLCQCCGAKLTNCRQIMAIDVLIYKLCEGCQDKVWRTIELHLERLTTDTGNTIVSLHQFRQHSKFFLTQFRLAYFKVKDGRIK